MLTYSTLAFSKLWFYAFPECLIAKYCKSDGHLFNFPFFLRMRKKKDNLGKVNFHFGVSKEECRNKEQDGLS